MQVAALRNSLIVVLLCASSLATKPAFAATSASQYRAQGLAYREQERYPEAIAALQKAVELDPQNLDGRVNLGWTLHLAGQEDRAATALSQALFRNPLFVSACNALGIVYLVSDDLNAAVMVHTWATLLKPDNEIAYYNLSLARQRLQQYDLAIATAQRAAELEPTNPHPLVALAIAHWGKGDRSAAQQAYRQAIDLDPRYREPAFLTNLQEAGFSPDQIQTAGQVLSAN